MPRFGSYRGGIGRVDLSELESGRLWTLGHRKRWMYLGLATQELWVTVAVVDLGYAGNAFVFVYDPRDMKMLAHAKAIGAPGRFDVNDCAGEGHAATFRSRGLDVSFERGRESNVYAVRARGRELEIDARLDAAGSPAGITAIAAIAPGERPTKVNVTQKRALLDVLGSVSIGGRKHSLDGGLAGYDHTSGLLARHTAWRWAFFLGRAKSGEKVAMNLVEGFVGEAECAAWVDGEIYPLAEGKFIHSFGKPLALWDIRTRDGAVDLRFSPGQMHADHTNLGLVRSSFVQPVGTYRGTMRLPGRAPLEIDGALGVAENQDVVW